MASPAAVRLRLEGYARGKIAPILQPLSERLLVEQPQVSKKSRALNNKRTWNPKKHGTFLQDPVSFIVRYLIAERSDLRTLVADGTLLVEQEDGRLVLASQP